ncbi:MAG: peptidase inhibitor family I36 protein [Pseudonocardiaceae bacterium]
MTRKTTAILSLVIAGTFVPLLSPGIAIANSTLKVACGSGQVCIYPEVNYGGTPYVRRATDSSTSLVGTPVQDKTFSVINNGTSPRTARIYRSNNYSGSFTCIQPGGRIADLRGFPVGQWGSSLKLDNDKCG